MVKNVSVGIRCFTVIVTLILILLNFWCINYVVSDSDHNNDSSTRGGQQPYNSFKQYIWGGTGSHADAMFGWNFTYIENLNGDQYPDLVVGTPKFTSGSEIDKGAVYIFFGKANSGFDNITYDQADFTIVGEGIGNNFGCDVADAGDVNGDGINDIIVGGPGAKSNRGRAYIFFGGNFPGSAQQADRILDGEDINVGSGAMYGSSVTGLGDINNDGYADVLVGAPGADLAVISYGYKKIINFYPDLWDDNLTTPNVVDFSNGLNNTPSDLNTWGLGAGDDGWDWIDNVADSSNLYGGDTVNDGGTHYGPWEPDGPDGDNLTWANKTALEITVGRNHTVDNPYGGGSNSPGGSAAWGIEFDITAEMFNYISTNSTIEVSFDYWAEDTEGFFGGSDNTEELCAIRSRIWNGSNPSDRHYIGDILRADGRWISRNYGGWGSTPWGPVSDHFQYNITEFIDHAGSYYWDFGCYLGNGEFGDDEGIIAFFDNIHMVITNNIWSIIQGAKNSGFGTTVKCIGDLNGDGYSDMMIGAPKLDGGHVALIHGKKRFKLTESINIASLFFTGKNPGDNFGQSISQAGDVDNDDIPDVIIGAPGGNYANLYYGSTLNSGPFVPDLWEADADKGTPKLEFDNGLKTTGNTPTITGANDGWDTVNGVYGGSGSSTRFNWVDGINPQNIQNDKELIIAIGRSYGNGVQPDSGAYGVKFSLTQNMMMAINSGSSAVIAYDWLLDDTGLDAGESAWIRTYIRNSTADFALGWNLDSAGVNEVFYLNDPVDASDFFIQDCTNCFDKSGAYYVDFGGRVEDWSTWGGSRENGIFHFDNFLLYITPPPDIKFIGPTDSGFGASVGYSDKLNLDDYSDIIIGAPYYDSLNGVNSGAVFGFFTSPHIGRTLLAENAEYMTYGENPNDYFGWKISGAFSLDTDDFNEITVSAINYDSPTEDNLGRVYVFSITKVPRIRLIHPKGGEVLNGSVIINATVTDPDDNIDTSIGVLFYYSTDLQEWTEIGNDKTPDANNIYTQAWDTTSLPDGSNYFLKAEVQDLELNRGVNLSLPVTIDNQHMPELTIQNPIAGESIEGEIEIKSLVIDSGLDTIGGGINTSKGIQFYVSHNKTVWELIDIIHSGKSDVYSVFLDTTTYFDGEYWLKVNANDLDGFEVEKIINVTIDNPNREPSIIILPIPGVPELAGTVSLRAIASDLDNDINASGVTFYLSVDDGLDNWMAIGNDQLPEVNTSGIEVYSITWDTTTVPDFWYRLMAFVNDTEGLTNASEIIEFKVHNNAMNAPAIDIVSPKPGKILEKTQVITARVRDLEDNIDHNGVFFYFSKDKVVWHFLGNSPKPTEANKEYYTFIWATEHVTDGKYWLNVSVSDETLLHSWDVLDEPVIIHNLPNNPPTIKILSPTLGQYINGTFNSRVFAYDMEENINKQGVMFFYSTNQEDWSVISNVETPTPSSSEGENIYELSWDTTKLPDGKYWMRVEATDLEDAMGFAESDYFFIHNDPNNAPVVTLLGPNSGEMKGTITLNATVFDLENNLDANGVRFYYSNNQQTWTQIDYDNSGDLHEIGLYYEIAWDTTTAPDDIYWLRASARDKTDLEGTDDSDDYITVHNNENNPPRIEFISPNVNDFIEVRQNIVVRVIDLENDLNTISFYYSKDNETWESIGTISKSTDGSDNYKAIWITDELQNGQYYIMVRAADSEGNLNEVIRGPFEVTQGKSASKETSATTGLLLWVIMIIVVIIVMFVVIFLVLRRSKDRERKLIEEVAAEAQASQVLEGEILSEPRTTAGMGMPDTFQTYIPPTEVARLQSYASEEEKIQAFFNQLNTWKEEGYNVTRLDTLYLSNKDMFLKAFVVFNSNISKLQHVSTKLDTMNTAGYEDQVSSIRSKLFEPDQALAVEREFYDLEVKLGIATPGLPVSGDAQPGAGTGTPGATPQLPADIEPILPQLMPAPTIATATEVQPSTSTSTGTTTTPALAAEQAQPTDVEVEVPPDIQLPPDIDLPPEDISEPATVQAPEGMGTTPSTPQTTVKPKQDEQ